MAQMKKKAVCWRGVTIGEGLPKVIVSVMGSTLGEMRESVRQALAAGAQILELRADSLSGMTTPGDAIAACSFVRREAGDAPVLFTLRTKRDGGAGVEDVEAYEQMLMMVIQSGVCEAVDVELSAGKDVFSRLAWEARMRGVSIVGSSHEFGEIEDVKLAGRWLQMQAALGADVCKAAVMPHSREEAFLLMAEMARAGETLHVPHVAIVMGEMGAASRVCAASLGSCMTFGAAGKKSAPGQIQAGKLREMLAVLGGGEE